MKRFLRSWVFWVLLGLALLAAAFYSDSAVQQWMTQHQTPAGKDFMREVSRWGDWPTHVVIGICGIGISWALRNRKWVAIFFAMLLACGLTGLINPAIKAAVGRSRPSVKTSVGWTGPTMRQKYHAFPSGHTVATSAFFVALLIGRRRLGIALLPIPILIATSRLYLNAHYLSDVVFGGMLGICCAMVAWYLVERWERSRPPPAPS